MRILGQIHKSGRELAASQMAVCLVVALFAPRLSAQANQSEIIFIDPDLRLLVIEPLPSGLKGGDSLCIFSDLGEKLSCDAKAQFHPKRTLIQVSAELIARLELGKKLIVRKIFLKEQGENHWNTPAEFADAYKQGKDHDKKLQNLPRQVAELPDQGSTGIDKPVVQFKAEEFPEIFVPKIRKKKANRDLSPDPTKQLSDSVRKLLKMPVAASTQFIKDQNNLKLEESGISDEEPRIDISPEPIPYEFFIQLFANSSLTPLFQVPSIRFETLRADELTRDGLWTPNKAKFNAKLAQGLELGLIRNRSRYFSLNWRRYAFEDIASATNLDQLDERLINETRMRSLLQAGGVEVGRLNDLSSYARLKLGLGLNLYDSQIRVLSETTGYSNSAESLLAYANSRWQNLTGCLRTAVQFERRGLALELGLLVATPVYQMSQSFDAGVNVPERIRFRGAAIDDLKKSIQHQKKTIGIDIMVGLNWVPQR